MKALPRRTTEAPSQHSGRRGGIPRRVSAPCSVGNSAPIPQESQSFLDHILACCSDFPTIDDRRFWSKFLLEMLGCRKLWMVSPLEGGLRVRIPPPSATFRRRLFSRPS